MSEPRVFVFRNGYLQSHNGGAGYLLPLPVDHLNAWDNLYKSLTALVKGAGPALDRLKSDGVGFCIHGQFEGETFTLIGIQDADAVTVTLSAADPQHPTTRVDTNALISLQKEVEKLRFVSENNPIMIWTIDQNARITWANGVYRERVRHFLGEEATRSWPIPAIFPDEHSFAIGRRRRRLTEGLAPDDVNQWYEVTVTEMFDTQKCVFAIPLDKVIKAEAALRDFIQSLTKTFASLSTGLAIFDRTQKLILFNPALIDITGLDAVLLAQRPSLAVFFDHICNLENFHEPEAYRSWRQKLTNVSQEDTPPPYDDVWPSMDGQSLRIKVRPQTDKSIALMIEDVSPQIERERYYQNEKKLFQSMWDLQDEAAVLVSDNGTLLGMNAAYVREWTDHNSAPKLGSSIKELVTIWENLCRPTSFWQEITAYFDQGIRQDTVTAELLRISDRKIYIRVITLQDGMIYIGFQNDTQNAVPTVGLRNEAIQTLTTLS